MPKSTPRIQLPGLSALCVYCVWLCLVPTGARLCLESSTSKVYFMTWDNDPTHATTFNTFAPDVLNSLQNNIRCTCTVHQLWILVSFDGLLFWSTVDCTLHISKCRIMPCLAENYSLEMGNYAESSSSKCGIMTCVPLQTMHSFNFVTCLTSLFLFTSIRFIWWMPQLNDA